MRKAQPAGSPGYTFPLMLVIVAAMAFSASRLDLAQSYRSKRDKEAELLFRGLAFKRAIKEFYSKNNRYPRQLKELANDRDSSKRRFIRQVYKDPMTGGDFKFILGSEGAIMGVLSSSKDAPFKKVDFEKELENFDKAKTYADWKFEAKPRSGAHQESTPASSAPQRIGSPL
jgi:hypothetical protein